MTFETVTVAEADGVATLTLNRPDKLNALNVTMGEELCAALEALGKSPTARVLVVTGAGRMFSAGGDLASMDQVVRSAAAIDHSVRIYCEVARRLRELPLPAVAKVNGDAFGGSLGIIMACDLRVARDDARLGFVFTRVGLSGADAGETARGGAAGRAAPYQTCAVRGPHAGPRGRLRVRGLRAVALLPERGPPRGAPRVPGEARPHLQGTLSSQSELLHKESQR